MFSDVFTPWMILGGGVASSNCPPQNVPGRLYTDEISRPHPYRACKGRSGEGNWNSQFPSENHPKPENRAAERVGSIVPQKLINSLISGIKSWYEAYLSEREEHASC
ncbi:hypothetical protein TNCV_1649571 [Trichonephila clavipes]|nr:hypothetical protein TNCV_1649571 [Trichonephila clavipes]